MTRTATTVRCAAVVGALALVTLAGASGADTTSATTLTLGTPAVSSSGVNVSGNAMMAALPATQVGKDAAGDGRLPGTDLTGASITPLGGGRIAFDLAIANMPPTVGSAPAVTHHNWEFAATSPDGESSTTLSLKAINGGAVIAGAVNTPSFSLNTCTPDPQTGQNTCTASYIDGAYSATGVRFLLDNAAISAFSGWSITPTGQGINVSPGASDVLWFTNGTGGDTMGADEFLVPDAVVKVGIAPAGTAPADVPLARTVDVPGSSWSTKLARPAVAGDYVVVAQACHGDVCSPLVSKAVKVV